MEIKKANDIFVATINNPNATTYDLTTLNLNPENTDLLPKDDYKQSKFIQDTFKTPSGDFDELAFDGFYNLAAGHYKEMTDDAYMKSLDHIQYSPFDVTRPKDSKTFNIDVEFSKDFNPFKQLYSRTDINSIDDNNFSLRELAQQNKVFDPITKTWSEKSANDMSLLDKFFGDTLVYAQWDEEGTHIDPETGRTVKHRKGDWKVTDDGNLYMEKLAGREIYGKQLANPMDMLTTDGSFANKFDFFDADNKENSALKTTVKLAAELAPLLVPGFNTYYAGVKAAVSLASVLPTFYKSFEGMLLGEHESSLNRVATAAEGYLAKFSTSSVSDAAQNSLFNYEQLGNMVADIFGQIYEQRAMASLSKYIMKNPVNIGVTEQKYLAEINKNIIDSVKNGKIDINDIEAIKSIKDAALEKLPQLKSFQKAQSQLAKSLSLGYMALTSTADVYGDAIQGGYDRRTAGFAALASAVGQYGIMMNNRMGDWFLDKTTGYTTETNKALVRKTAREYLEPIKEAFNSKNTTESKVKLAGVFKNFKNSLIDTFTSPSELGEAIFKNAFIEGVEEVTEQGVQDMTKGIIDVMSYFGLTSKQGSFGGFDTIFSKQGFENYLANFVGGLLGGAMFEFNTAKLEPLLSGEKISKDTKRDIYKLVANGQTELLIDEVNKQRNRLGNSYLSPITNQEGIQTAVPGKSQADLIADTAIGMIKNIDGIMNAMDFKLTDDEIIKKAMIDHLIIKDLNATKGDGKIGIEGLILEDYHRAVEKVIDIQTEIQKLITGKEEEVEKNKEAVKRLREESKIYEAKIADIKEGKNAEKYYNQAIFYLSKPISGSWLTIDKDIYARNKYGVDFDQLPPTGFGLTKERVEKEWKDYLDAKDIRTEIEVATNAYLELEKNLNPSLEQYMSSGYDIERAKTYQYLLDLDSTIQMFNTATDPTVKQNVLNKFKFINEQLKEISKVNILPWDVYRSDLGEKIISSGMVGTATLNENGEYLTDSETGHLLGNILSEEELNKTNEAGIKMRDNLKTQIDLLFSEVPLNPLHMDESIKILNQLMLGHNQKIDAKLLAYGSKESLSDEDSQEIQNLKAQKYSFILLPFQLSGSTNQLRTDHNIKEAELTNKFLADTDLSKDILEKYRNNEFFDLNDSTVQDELSRLKWLTDVKASDISEEFVENLSEEQKENFNKSSFNIELNQEKDLRNRLLEAKAKLEISNLIQKNESALSDFTESEGELITELNTSIEKLKPEFLHMRNYALDLILDQLKGTESNSPNKDAEIINAADKMIKSIVDTWSDSLFPGFKIDSPEDLMYFVENHKNIGEKIKKSKSINKVEEDEESGDLMAVIDYSKETILAENFGDPFDKYISDDKDMNSRFLSTFTTDSKFLGLYGVDQVKSFLELKTKELPKVENSLYKFLENFALSLQNKPRKDSPTVFSVLEREEKSLLAVSDINNFLTEGIKLEEVQKAIDVIDLVKSVVLAMSTTQVGFEDIYGFIASRQNFLKKNNIDSESLQLKTVTSDIAQLMLKDLDRIRVKLQFYIDLAKSNSAQISNEHEIIRTSMVKILYDKLTKLIRSDILKELKPKFEEIERDKNLSSEKKLIRLESAIYEHFRTANKTEVLRDLLKLSSISIDGRKLPKITKEVKEEDIDDYTFATYLATVLSVDARDFNAKLHNLLKDFDKAPFFAQEFAVRIAYASIVEKDLFSSIIEFDKEGSEKNITDLITYVLGGGGTGKTTVVFKMLTKYLQINNPKLSIWFSGPEQDQATKLESDVLKDLNFEGTHDTFSKLALYERIGIKDEMIEILKDFKSGNPESEYFTWINNKRITLKEDVLQNLLNKAFKDTSGNLNQNLPNLILIDEVTHFSSLELQILNDLIRHISDSHFIKIVAAGDTSQTGIKTGADQDAIEANVDRVKGIFTNKLFTSVRAANVWQRENNDLTITLSEKVSDIFHDNSIDEDTRIEKVKELLNIYKNEKLFNLKYYQGNSELGGAIIDAKFSDTTASTLRNIFASEDGSDKTLGILTTDGNYELYTELLNKLKLINPDGSLDDRVKIFSLDNIQGNEVDYFIFDTKDIRSVRPHHKLKDFYTYLSRSKDATIIIDSANYSDEFNIINSKQSINEVRQPLIPEVISEIKSKRIATLEGLLDGNFEVKYDNFKFISEPLIDEDTIDNSILEELPVPDIRDVDATELQAVPDDFNYMFHTFYNNPNVKVQPSINAAGVITYTDIKEITYDELGTNTDLNIAQISPEKTQQIIKGWLAIKNDYSYDKKIENDKDSLEYLKAVFGNSITVSKIKTSTILTASKFRSEVNMPVYKDKFDVSKLLTDGDPFINVSLKLESNGKVHYITLATISANTISSAFGLESNSYDLYQKVFNKLKLENLSKIKEIAVVDFKNQITSLRFLPGMESKTIVSETTDKYKGSKYSKLRFFPSTYEAFVSVWNAYTFGETRNEADLKITKKNGTEVTIPGLKSLFKKYKGKPYIAISYGNDTLGSDKKKTQARLVPLYTEKRSFGKVREDIQEWRDLFFSNNTTQADSEESVESTSTNSLTEAEKAKIARTFKNMVSVTQLIDYLVKVSENFPEAFDGLITPIEVVPGSNIKTIPLDLIKKVGGEKNRDTIASQVMSVFKTIQKLRGKKSNSEIREEVWTLLSNANWKNYIANIFILDKFAEGDRKKAKTFEDKKAYDTIIGVINDFHRSLQSVSADSGFYWETSRKGSDVVTSYEENTTSDIIKKLNRFQPESYLFFKSIPESPRFLLNLENEFSSYLNPVKEVDPVVVESVKTDEQKEIDQERTKPVRPKKSVTEKKDGKAAKVSPIGYTNKFGALLERFRMDTSPGSDWRFELADIFTGMSDNQLQNPIIDKIQEMLGIEYRTHESVGIAPTYLDVLNTVHEMMGKDITQPVIFKTKSLLQAITAFTKKSNEEIKNIIKNLNQQNNCK